ncbi:hypothetical protein GJAV_G00048510 [Gymnothorax javanicus]|nr:hypothetical protein GJAV_G00048510 [Gymnothorax javanicus]
MGREAIVVEIKKIVEKAFPGMLAKLLTPAVAVESVSPPTQRTTQNQEAPDGAEEMDPLSLPERTTEHRQEMPQDATEMEPLCSSTKSEVIAPPISQFK